MPDITVRHHPEQAELDQLGVSDWPIWGKGVSRFAWEYDSKETSYLLEGEVIVTPEGGAPITLVKGDLVTFPAGLRCTWDIKRPIRKHYLL